jgi:hypothetical protein
MTLKLKVGKKYRNRNGAIRLIYKKSSDPALGRYKYKSKYGYYSINGKSYTDQKEHDLVEEVIDDEYERYNQNVVNTNEVIPQSKTLFDSGLIFPYESHIDRFLTERKLDDNTTDHKELDEKASKFDSGKNYLAAIPVQGLIATGTVFTYGKEKYGLFNYKKGHKSTQLISALMRHVWEGYMSGEDNDKESGLSHLAHAAANLLMLIQQHHDNTIDDDRPKVNNE